MTKIIITIIFVFILSNIQAQVFQISDSEYFRNMLFWGCLDLGNNYAEDIIQSDLTLRQVEGLKRNDIPFFDNWISFKTNKNLKAMSDYSYAALLGISLVLTYDEGYVKENLMVMSQILLMQSAIGKWVKTVTARKRPYVFDKNSNKINQNSFYSLHSSGAFAIATFTYFHYTKNNGRNYYLAAVLFSGASLTAVLRVASAQHFPSDVTAGAIAGSLISYLVCRNYFNSDIQLTVNSNYLGLKLNF
jgi:PAP2 superfamily protein